VIEIFETTLTLKAIKINSILDTNTFLKIVLQR